MSSVSPIEVQNLDVLKAWTGADEKTCNLIQEALRCLPYIDARAINFKYCTPLFGMLIAAIERFGLKLVRLDWNKFPKCFRRNPPRWEVFPASTTEAEIDTWLKATIALNQNFPRKKGKAAK
jgi:hypothetical protein